MATRLFVELARAPDAHQRQPDPASGNEPLAADTDRCLRYPWTPADVVTAAKQVAVK